VVLDIAKSIPVPESSTVCGLVPALSVSVSVPLRLPASLGEKVTLMVQLAPAATESPQVLVCAKSPVRANLRAVRVPLPASVSVIVCGALLVETVSAGNVRLVLERFTTGAGAVPLSVTVCGLFAAASVIVRVPVCGPNKTGWKLTLIVQLELAATVGRQLLVSIQPLEIDTLLTPNTKGPLLVRVTG
jgi:hypothetical protein